MPSYKGVDVEHPRMVEYIRGAVRQGFNTAEIVKRSGMHHEVVNKYEREVRQEMSKKKKPKKPY